MGEGHRWGQNFYWGRATADRGRGCVASFNAGTNAIPVSRVKYTICAAVTAALHAARCLQELYISLACYDHDARAPASSCNSVGRGLYSIHGAPSRISEPTTTAGYSSSSSLPGAEMHGGRGRVKRSSEVCKFLPVIDRARHTEEDGRRRAE